VIYYQTGEAKLQLLKEHTEFDYTPMMEAKALLNSITTVFAWVPAAILLFLALFGVVNVLVNWQLVSLLMFISTLLVAVGACCGFMALTAICWQLKFARKWKILGLCLGISTLLLVILAGAYSQHEILELKLDWVELYLFIGPLSLGLLQLYLLKNK